MDADAQQILTYEFYSDGSGKLPPYYQLNVINRTVEAIARGQNRVLLVIATGTGKTYTVFQIIWRLPDFRSVRSDLDTSTQATRIAVLGADRSP